MDIDKMTLISYNNGIKLCVVRTPVSHTHKPALNMPALGMPVGGSRCPCALDFAPYQGIIG